MIEVSLCIFCKNLHILFYVVLPSLFPLIFTLNLWSFFCFVGAIIIMELKVLGTISP